MKFLFVRSDVCRQLPSDSTSRWTPLLLAIQFPLIGLARDFHPLDNAHAERTDRYSFLLKARKNFIDGIVLEHQDVLLADIIAFNEALRLALQKMYDHAHLVWTKIKNDSLFGNSKELVARCFLPSQYPALHPVHRKNSEALYGALQDAGWNKFYEDGVSFMPLRLAEGMEAETFDAYIGMDCPPPNWNEGLDQELTKDLHLILQFNHLFEYTNFALTDFIYCRDFESQTEITLG